MIEQRLRNVAEDDAGGPGVLGRSESNQAVAASDIQQRLALCEGRMIQHPVSDRSEVIEHPLHLGRIPAESA